MWQIIGSGAIGCLWAANLLDTGQQVHLVSRLPLPDNKLIYQDLNKKTVLFTLSISTQLQTGRVKENSPILVCVKAPQVKEAIARQLNFISPTQPVILMHNGLGCAQQVQKLLPNNPIICATTANASLLQTPLHIQHTGKGFTYLGAFNKQAQDYKGIAEPLNLALENSYWCADIEQKLWLKLLINIAINPLTAIYQINNGGLQALFYQDKIKEIIKEAVKVTRKLGFDFTEELLLENINQVISATASNYSSMNRDIYLGRKTENEYINGYLLKKGAEFQLSTPLIKSLYQQIIALENHSLTQ